jgi:outer membrane receptor for ferrienterochelin and colicins
MARRISIFNYKRLIIFCFIVFLLYPGYVVSQELSFKDLLQMPLEELLNISVNSASKKPETISEIPASVVVITRRDIEVFGYQSIDEILQNVPGLYLIDDYGWTGSKGYGVRGFYTAGNFYNMIVMVDGVNQGEMALNGVFTEMFEIPVESIEKIEIVRGPMSVILGSGAFFGSIDIVTSSFDDKSTTNLISTSAGNSDTYKGSARLSGKTGDFQYCFNAGYSSSGGLSESIKKMMSDPSVVTKSPADSGWGLNSFSTKGLLENRRQYFNFIGKFDKYTFNVGITNSRKEMVESMFGHRGGNFVDLNTAHASIKHETKISNEFSIKSKFDFVTQNHWVDNHYYYDFNYTKNIYYFNNYDAEIDLFYSPSRYLNFTFGLNRRTGYNNVIADYPLFGQVDTGLDSEPNITVHSLFSQMEYQFRKKVKLVIGLRLEKPEPYDVRIFFPNPTPPDSLHEIRPPIFLSARFKPANSIEIIPRLALIYSLNSNNHLKFLYGQAIKQPPFVSIFDRVYNNSSILKPETVQTYELNYIGTITKNIALNISLYRNELKNLISRMNVMDPVEGAILISSSSGKMSTDGFEIGLISSPIRKLKIDISTSYQIPRDERAGFDEIEPGYSPALLAYFKMSYYVDRSFSMAVTARYVDEMETGWNIENLDMDNRPIIPVGDQYNGRIGYKVDGYLVTGMNFRYSNILNTNYFCSLNISNILNESIFYPATSTNPMFDLGTMGMGRTFLITIGWQSK